MVREASITVFKAYPIQMCHFHQKQIVRRYITKNPKPHASMLKHIMYSLTNWSFDKTILRKSSNLILQISNL
jgi:hypothetical protein